MKLMLAIALLLVVLQAQIIPFDNGAIDKIFQQKKSAVFLFIGDEAEEASAREAFTAYDQTNPEVILTISSKNDGHGLFERLAEYVGVNTEQTPQVLFLNEQTQKFKFDSQSITAESLASFVQRVQSGEISPFLKSAPIPEPSDDPVQVVVGKNFKQVVLDSEKEVLAKFYAPWCGHCKTLAPHYEEAARRLSKNPNILLIKVDSTENEISGLDIQGFPTLKFYRKDKSVDPIEYSGERDADGIIKWIKEHTEYKWVEPSDDEEETVAAQEEL